MAFPWVDYILFGGIFLGSGGFGIGWGQFRLGVKETIDATGA